MIDLSSAVCVPCANHEEIDDALRSWLDLVSAGRDQYLQDEDDLARCSQFLLDSPIYAAHVDYVQTQIIYSLLQEDEARPLHAIANYLLLAGRSDEAVFQQMIDAGCFARLVELIKNRRDDDRRLHRLLLELMYEMARIERIRISDLMHVDDAFIIYLFQIIEDVSDDISDPYHYPIIRVLLVLNEQYMVAATTAAVDPMSPAAPLTNRVIKVLSLNGPLYRTFGENIILLLNRETETSLQLLILKLMYLLFTTKATYEYFYTNDLRVLLDVIIRNLLDLPNESTSLRHTYLRVLYPLLAHTQLNQPPQYKRGEILRVLAILSGSGNVHFAPADETTVRLVDRVSKVDWLAVTPPTSTPASPSSPTGTSGTVGTNGTAATVSTTVTAATDRSSSASSSESTDGVNEERNHVVNKFLGISLSHEGGGESRVSVADVANVTEKPGVKTPSRKAEFCEAELQQAGDPGRPPANEQHSQTLVPSGGDDSHPIPAVVVEFEPHDETVKQKHFDQPTLDAKTLNESGLNTNLVPSPTPAPATLPERKLRPRRALPAVPKHRHGVVLVKPPQAEEAAPAATPDTPGSDASGAGAYTHTSPANGSIKKLPPKAPPPRRGGRLRQTASNTNLHQTVESS